MRFVIPLIIVLVLVAASYQLYQLYGQYSSLKTRFEKLDKETAVLVNENEEIKAGLDYYKIPENLVKELKSKFDYKRPDEQMYIIVPKR